MTALDMSITMSIPSDYGVVDSVLRERMIVFKEGTIMENPAMDFDREWDKFLSVCGLSKNKAVWTASRAQSALVRVFSSAYKKEIEFSKALFAALKKALGGKKTLQELAATGCESAFAIKGRAIGLAVGLERYSLGFKKGYAASVSSPCDHSVVVFTAADGQFGLSTYDERDVTASIELKMTDTNCIEFPTDSNGMSLGEIDLAHEHGPFGQTIVRALETMHCLARRGINVRQIALNVAAGTRKRDAAGESRICCVDGTLNIPQKVGDHLSYSVTSQTSFYRNQTTVAMYIRALRRGMEYAAQIESQCQARPVKPLSLCGATASGNGFLQFKGITATGLNLIASPIPGAEIIEGWSIHQGELFRCNSVSFARNAFNDTSVATNALIKISSAPVHNSLVAIDKCAATLTDLRLQADVSLKHQIGKVLLAFEGNLSGTLVTVMRDLSRSSYPEAQPSNASLERISCIPACGEYKVLNHRAVGASGKESMCKLWEAWQTLVENLLLPLQNVVSSTWIFARTGRRPTMFFIVKQVMEWSLC
jgi:hypothetical protein